MLNLCYLLVINHKINTENISIFYEGKAGLIFLSFFQT